MRGPQIVHYLASIALLPGSAGGCLSSAGSKLVETQSEFRVYVRHDDYRGNWGQYVPTSVVSEDRPTVRPDGDAWFVEVMDKSIVDSELKQIVEECLQADIPGLSVSACGQITDEGLQGLDEVLRHFRTLSLAGCRQLSGRSLRDLDLRCLRELYLDEVPVEDDELPFLIRPRLQVLSLRDTRISDKGVAYLLQMRELERLSLQSTEVGDGCLSHIVQLRSLVDLDLSLTRVADIQVLSSLPNLRGLYLYKCPITDGALLSLTSRRPNIEALSLIGCTSVTDRGIRDLYDMPSLRYVGLTGTQVTEQAVNRLRKALPQCHVE